MMVFDVGLCAFLVSLEETLPFEPYVDGMPNSKWLKFFAASC